MSEVQIRIGGRPFTVACQPGEESYLEAAAEMLDAEAKTLVDQLGKMPESQMLLMAGLMLADKTAGLEDQLRGGKGGRSAPAAPPKELTAKLAALAEKAETLAVEIEAKAG